MVSLERSLARVVGTQQGVAEEVLRRTKALGQLQRQWQRRQLLRLRRSEMGKSLFGRSQRRLLRRAFAGWMEVVRWQQGTKLGFQVKIRMTKHAADLDRLERQPAATRGADGDAPETILSRHAHRTVC